MKTMPVPLEQGRAACSDPQHLPLVDAAFAKPGGPEAQEMKRTLCRECPVREQCLAWAMTHPEVGIWGETSPHQRTRAGVPSAARATLHSDHVPPKPSAAEDLCRALGVRGTTVKHWAHEQGLVATTKGRVSLAHVEAWAAAHQAA